MIYSPRRKSSFRRRNRLRNLWQKENGNLFCRFFSVIQKVKNCFRLNKKKSKTFSRKLSDDRFGQRVICPQNLVYYRKEDRFREKFSVRLFKTIRSGVLLHWEKTLAAILIFTLVSSSLFLLDKPNRASADYINNVNQGDWSGGADTITTVNSGNVGGWNKFYSKGSTVSSGTNLSISPSAASSTIDFDSEGAYVQEDAVSGTDFAGGIVNLANMIGPYTLGATYNYTGANQNLVIPAGVTSMQVKLWGAGGGGGAPARFAVANGGGGGFASSTISVTPSETLTVVVGGGGGAGTSSTGGLGGFGGGGISVSNQYGGGGGGRSAIIRSSTNLIVAGAGGGGGYDYAGGAGGGLVGLRDAAGASDSGYGGTQSAGGGALPNGATAGSLGQGGNGCTYGGGGGSGYYGGGGGGCTNAFGGGGGGSSYIGGGTGGTTIAGSGKSVANSGDVDYVATVGVGGNGGVSTNGGNGRIVVYYPSIVHPTTPYYVTTSNTSHFNTSTWKEIASTATIQTTPTNTDIKYLVSFDSRATWKYWNGSTWLTSSLDNLQTNGMTKTVLEGLSSVNWSASGGFVAGSTATLDFAMDLATADETVTPSLDQIQVNYTAFAGADSLISSKFDSGSVKNSMGGISWIEDETLPVNSEVSLALRTAASEGGLDSVSWSTIGTSSPGSLTAGCTKVSGTVTCDATTIPTVMKTGGDDRWFQYKVSITAGENSPIVTNINPIYEQDVTPPTITSITSTSTNGEYKEGSHINITLNFSEPVVSATGLTVTLNTGGSFNIPAWNVATASAAGNYTVGAGQSTSDLTVTNISGNITDQPANSLTLSAATIPFTTEGDYIQEDASGTSFSGGSVILGTALDSYTKLLIHADEASGSTTLVDSSASGHSITAMGAAATTSAVTKFNNTLALSNAGDYLSVADSDDFDFGGGNFTIDFFYNYNTGSSFGSIFSRTAGPGYSPAFVINGAGANVMTAISFANNNWDVYLSLGATEVGVWHHYAIVRNGSIFYGFRDGILTSTYSNGSIIPDKAAPAVIGYYAGDTLRGHLDEFRLSKGIARWTSNFTPPTDEYGGYYTNGAYYVTTSDTSQINTSTWTELNNVSVSGTTPTDTSIKYLVSFDNRSTWKYWNGSLWADSSLANLQIDGMSKSSLEELSSAAWEASGGFIPGVTTTLDFAMDFESTNKAVTPTLDAININYIAQDPAYINTTTNPSYSNSNLATNADIIVDTAAPASVVTIPNGTTTEYSQINSLTGTASDNHTLSQIDITIQDTDTGDFWTGSSWGAQTWLSATGTATWSYNSSAVNWGVNDHFTVKSRATDLAGNVETPSAGKSFVFVNSPPTVTINSVTKTTGNVVVNYDITDVESVSTTVYLAYDSGATLSNNLDSSSTASIQVSDASKFPASGTILLKYGSGLDTRYEHLSYASKSGNYLEGITRATNGTQAYSHASGATIRIKANALSDDTGTVANGTGKTITWNAGADTNFYNNSETVSVVANDGASSNNIGLATSDSFIFDSAAPVITATNISALTDPATLTFSVSDDTAIQMMVSLNSDFSGASWENYNASKTIALATAPDTVYVKFKDAQDSTTATQVLTTPATPQSLMIQDVSSVAQDKWKLYTSWQIISEPTAGFEAYRIYRSTSANGTYVYQGSTASENINVDYYADAVNENDAYYYKLAAEDRSGNISAFSSYVWGNANATQDAGEGGGGSSGDTTAPTITAGPTVTTTTATAATIIWTTNEAADSFVEYGLTDSYGSVFGDANIDTNHSIVLPETLSGSTTYHFRVRTRDAAGNLTLSDDDTFDTEEGADDTAPVISVVFSGTSTATSTTIAWTTNENSDSLVDFGTVAGVYTNTQGNSEDSVTEHSVTLSSLSPSTTYYFRVKSSDSLGNQATNDSNYSFTTAPSPDPGDVTAPVISAITTTNLTSNSVIIAWTTNENADSTVGYSTDETYTQEKGTIGLTQTHSITLTGLTPATIYYFRVKSRDAAGNLKTETNSSLYTFNTAVEDVDESDTTPPVISDVLITNLTYKTATIVWNTDEASNSLVDYGTAVNYGESYGKSEATVTTHSVTLPNLQPLTTYYFQAKSQDSHENLATKSTDSTNSVLSFTTPSAAVDVDGDGTGDQLSDISNNIQSLIDSYDYSEEDVKNVLGTIYSITSSGPSAKVTDNTTATITWNTNKDAIGKVVYWQDASNEDTSISVTETATNINSVHEVILKNLNPQTKYDYYVISDTPLGSEVQSGTETFTTGDVANLSAVSVGDITLNSAVVLWTANSLDSLKVEYGNSTKYGKEVSAGSAGSNSSHALQIDSLSSGQVYHFCVKGVDSDGVEVTSGDYSFKTLELPEITSVKVQDVTSEKATIGWKTNIKTDSAVEYQLQGADSGTSQGKLEAVNDHEIILTDLIPGTTYEYKVSSKDQFGNKSESEFQSFTTSDDSEPPKIKSVKSEATVFPNKDTKVQTILSWSTDKPTNSVIAYREGGVAGDDGINEKMQDGSTQEFNGWKIQRKEDNSFNHMFVLIDFNPASVYYFKVASIDKRGHISISDNYSLITPVKKKSVFDLIVNNFEETFGWVKRVGN